MSEPPVSRMLDGITLRAWIDTHVFSGLAELVPVTTEDNTPIALFADRRPGA